MKKRERKKRNGRDSRVKRGIFYSGMPAARWPHPVHLFGAGFARGLERARSLSLLWKQDSGLMASRPYFVVCHPRAVAKYLLVEQSWPVNGQASLCLTGFSNFRVFSFVRGALGFQVGLSVFRRPDGLDKGLVFNQSRRSPRIFNPRLVSSLKVILICRLREFCSEIQRKLSQIRRVFGHYFNGLFNITCFLAKGVA